MRVLAQTSGVVHGLVLVLRHRHIVFIAEHTGHAAHHVIQDVAVEHPVVVFVGLELDRALCHGRHINRVLQRRVFPLPHQQAEEVPVQMDWVVHHRVIDEFQLDDLPPLNRDVRLLGNGLAIEGPHIAVHVAG